MGSLWKLEAKSLESDERDISCRTVKFYITKPGSYTIGRLLPKPSSSDAPPDVAIDGDISISRKHATLIIPTIQQVLASDTSIPYASLSNHGKYGSFVSKTPTLAGKPIKDPATLYYSSNWFLKFGHLSPFRLTLEPIHLYISPAEAQQTDPSIVEEFIQLVQDSYPVTITSPPPPPPSSSSPSSSSLPSASGLKVVFFNPPDYKVATSKGPGEINLPTDSGKLLALLYGGQPVKAEWIRELLSQNVWKNSRPMEADYLPENIHFKMKCILGSVVIDTNDVGGRDVQVQIMCEAVQKRLKSMLSEKVWKDTVFIWPSARTTKDESLQKAVELVGGTNINCPTTIKARKSNESLQQAIANQVENNTDKRENKVFKAIYVKPKLDSRVPSDLEILPNITNTRLVAAFVSTHTGSFEHHITLPPGQEEGDAEIVVKDDDELLDPGKKRKSEGNSAATPGIQEVEVEEREEGEGEEGGGGHHAIIQDSQDVEMEEREEEEEEGGGMVEQPEPATKQHQHQQDTTTTTANNKEHLPSPQQKQQPLGDGWMSTKQIQTNITKFAPIPQHMRQPSLVVKKDSDGDKKNNKKGDDNEWDQGVIDPELECIIPIKKNRRGKSREDEEEDDGDQVVKGGEGESVVVVAPLVLASKAVGVGAEAVSGEKEKKKGKQGSGRVREKTTAIVHAPSPMKNFKAFKKTESAVASSPQQKNASSNNNMSVVMVPFSSEVYREELPDGDAYVRKERTRQAEDKDAEVLFNAKVKAKKVAGGAEMKKAPAQKKTTATGGSGGRGGRGGSTGRGGRGGRGRGKAKESESEFESSEDVSE